jgi:aminopeptidase N
MKWWDDIWLNEGFATWMETKPVAAWKPEWKISQDEVLTSQRALETDSAQNTRPIRQSAQGRQEINSLFDGIAYGKTSAVLRMLEGFLGREEFRKGVNAYLQSHAYSNATAQDFWGAMAAASGKPIDKMMPTFVTQPGVPYVDLEASCVNGETLAKLSQRRFIASPKAMQNDSNELWQLPLLMKEIGGNGKESREVFDEKQREFKLAGCGIGVFPNVNGAGYYRYSVAPSLIAADKFKVQELSEEDQVSLVGNEGALLSAGLHNIENLMTLAAKFQGVETEGAIEELGAQLKYASRYLVTERDRPQFQAWVANVFKPTLQNIGATPVKSEPPTRSNVRADLIGILGAIADDPEAIAVAKQTVAAYMQDPTSVDATLVDASFPVAAAHGDAALYDAFLQKMKSASSPQDYYRYFRALAQFRDPALLKRTLEWSLGPDVRNQDLSIILRVLNNPYGQRIAWDFIRERYGDIQKKAGQSIVGAQAAYLAAGALCDAKSRAEAESFLAQHRVEGMDRVGRQQMERMDQCIDLRQREEPNLTKYLDKTSNASGQH